MSMPTGHKNSRECDRTDVKRIEEARDERERDRLLGRLGALATRAQTCEPLPHEDNDLPFDARGHRETWNDAIRLQEEGREPAAFAVIDVPVLMVHGAQDPHPGELIHATLQTHLPHVELELLDRCGHEPWRERHARERFLELLERRLLGLSKA